VLKRVLKTRPEWGEHQVSEADLFRGFAEDQGLNLTVYNQSSADPAISERVRDDFTEGPLTDRTRGLKRR
jgi:hypothetical protein